MNSQEALQVIGVRLKDMSESDRHAPDTNGFFHHPCCPEPGTV